MASAASTRQGSRQNQNEPHRSLQQDTAGTSALIISGGSAGNQILDAFTSLFEKCTFVLPVSDNGGSSSEIIRVLGGPSLGDIRSRLVRLIPDTPDKAGIRDLFEYRLPSNEDSQKVKGEWLEIVEGSHPLWRNIPTDRREAIRAFLVHFEHAILRRAQRRFNFLSGSVGNFWLAGAQLFVRSLQSAIFLFSSVCGISSNHTVIPAINTNSLVTIAAELYDGSRIVGQNEISHPSNVHTVSAENSRVVGLASSGGVMGGSYTPASNSGWLDAGEEIRRRMRETSAEAELDYDDSPGVIARSKYDMEIEQDLEDEQDETRGSANIASVKRRRSTMQHNIIFSKSEDDWVPLPSRVSRIFYLNTYGQETYPAPSSAFLNSLSKIEVLVYSCGSLFTSLIPPLALTGVGNAIALSPTIRYKILLLNGTFDRETEGLTAVDFIQAVTEHLNSGIRNQLGPPPPSGHLSTDPRRMSRTPHQFLASDYVTHLIYPVEGSIPVDVARLTAMNISCIPISSQRFSDTLLRTALKDILAL